MSSSKLRGRCNSRSPSPSLQRGQAGSLSGRGAWVGGEIANTSPVRRAAHPKPWNYRVGGCCSRPCSPDLKAACSVNYTAVAQHARTSPVQNSLSSNTEPLAPTCRFVGMKEFGRVHWSACIQLLTLVCLHASEDGCWCRQVLVCNL